MHFVLKRKGTLKQTWSHKRNEAKQAYESMINNQNKARIFDDWVQTEFFYQRNTVQKPLKVPLKIKNTYIAQIRLSQNEIRCAIDARKCATAK